MEYLMPQPFDPDEFLVIARELVSQGDNEGRLRTAVSRAYYSSMLKARALLHVQDKRDVGGKVIGQLRRSRVLRAAGEQLEKLLRLRRAADYELVPEDAAYYDWS